MGPSFARTAFLGCVWWVHTHVHVVAWARSRLYAPHHHLSPLHWDGRG